MFFRSKKVRNAGVTYEYLQLVESRREGDRVKQKVVLSLGRVDELRESGALDRLAQSIGRFTQQVIVLDALREGSIIAERCRDWGPSLVFDRIWHDEGVAEVLKRCAQDRQYQFEPERIAFSMALQRLLRPQSGSDRDGLAWLDDVRIDGLTDGQAALDPALQHYYRTVAFLSENKDEIERSLWLRGRDLFNRSVDVALFDTTSLYFEGEGPAELAARGKSKDGKYSNTQVVVGVVLTQDGWPLCAEVWPGNRVDSQTVVPLLETLRDRFSIRRVVLVSDRGMVSKKNLEAIEKAGYDYIIGCRLRNDNTVRDEVLGRAGRYREVSPNMRVKQVRVGDERYVVCHNPQQAERDRDNRERVVASLREKLVGKTPKKAIHHRGYKRFLDTGGAVLAINEKAIEQDARYDGKWVLRTSTDWSAEEVAKAYKSLWMVERFFRDFKGPINTRPIYHHKEEHVRGHIVGCFLGLYLAVALRKRLEALRDKRAEGAEWKRVIDDLRSVKAIELQLEGKPFLVRSELRGQAWLGFMAAGMKAPPRVQPTEPVP